MVVFRYFVFNFLSSYLLIKYLFTNSLVVWTSFEKYKNILLFLLLFVQIFLIDMQEVFI